jgi:GNAT superfamily N-acetyltransferase
MGVRHATLTDINELLTLGRDFHRKYWSDRPYEEEIVASSLRTLITGLTQNSTIFVAEDDSHRLTGLLVGGIDEALFVRERHGKVRLLYVPGEERHKGWGRRLMRAFEQWALLRKATCIEVRLSSKDRDLAEAQSGLARMGYQRAEEIHRRMTFTETEGSKLAAAKTVLGE